MAASYNTLHHLLQAAGAKASPSRPLRFLLVSTHAQQTTGYSKVSYNIVKEMSACPDIQVFHFGFQRFFFIGDNYRPYPPNVEVYDPVAQEAADSSLPKEQGFGYSQLPAYIRKVQPDVVLLYNDAGVICQFLEKISAALKPEERTYKMVIYLDQVYTLQRPEFLARMDRDADVYFAFTEYWRSVLKQQGIQKPIHILRHGFDGDVFKPLDRAALRRKHNVAENLFLLINLNRNTPRKRYDLLMSAFAELVARYPTKPIALLCVCDGGQAGGGFPIHEIFVRELIKRGVPADQHMGKLLTTKTALNYTDEMVNELYAMADVGVTTAEGEGFGLCQFEAMGCGIPQVVPDIGGFKDFCTADNSVRVKPAASYYIPLAYSGIGGVAEVVDPADYCLGLEEYLLDSELRGRHGRAARETVLKYSWKEEVGRLVEVVRGLVHTKV